ncbi:hypothetical protein [Lachnotalea glycerini]|uniref:Uncharacterized protein n=1 Tax=Lachnotalea glycerini TaxID=1763509 RepID=A0A371JIY0_9FIRM|nr:hypothetical protein [Lachnotalea glycerini]RDY32679.1 hypothetical protein CG710_004435 [Lachnotalea glycerini]
MKRIKAYSVVLIMLMLITGCTLKSFDADTNTVYVKKDGTVMQALIEDFGESYYDSKELEELINENVSAYNGDTDKVKVEKYNVNDNVAKLITSFSSASDYAKFNNVEFFAGTISDAKSEEYDFNQEFTAIEDKNTVGAETIKSLTQYKVVIFEENVQIKTDSKILYLSDNATLVGEKTAKLTDDAEGLGYIVYE